MADMDSILQVEMLGDGRRIGRIMVHVVTITDLSRAAVPPTIMRDDAEPLSKEEEHLRIPIVRAQRPTVMEDDWLSVLRSPILEEDLDAVFGRYE